MPFILVSGLYMPVAHGFLTIKYENFHAPHFYIGKINSTEDLTAKLKSIAGIKGVVNMSDQEAKELILRVEADNKGKALSQSDIDVTSVVWWAKLKRALSEGDIISKQILRLANEQEAVLYLMNGGTNFDGEAIGDNIVINLPNIREKINIIMEKVASFNKDAAFFRVVYDNVTAEQLAISEYYDAIYHEGIHVLTRSDIGNGNINHEYMENIFQKYNIPEDLQYDVTLELVAYLGELSASKFPKRLLWEFAVNLDKSLEDKYRICFEIITEELLKGRLGYGGGINRIDRQDFISVTPDAAIKMFSSEFYHKILGEKPPNRLFLAPAVSTINEIVKKYYGDALLVPSALNRVKDSGSSPMRTPSASSAVERINVSQGKYGITNSESQLLYSGGALTCVLLVFSDEKGVTALAHIDAKTNIARIVSEMINGMGVKGAKINNIKGKIIESGVSFPKTLKDIRKELEERMIRFNEFSSVAFTGAAIAVNNSGKIVEGNIEAKIAIPFKAHSIRIEYLTAGGVIISWQPPKGNRYWYDVNKGECGITKPLKNDYDIPPISDVEKKEFLQEMKNALSNLSEEEAKIVKEILVREYGSSPLDSKGGIAFNALPIQTEAVASSVLGAFSGVKAFQGDLDAEWAQIQAVFNAGIRPSVQRISEYTAAAASSALAGEKIDQVRSMLADILRSEEEDKKMSLASADLKNLVTALES